MISMSVIPHHCLLMASMMTHGHRTPVDPTKYSDVVHTVNKQGISCVYSCINGSLQSQCWVFFFLLNHNLF